MNDPSEQSAIDRLRALAATNPLPPIGSFEADLIRPPVGRVKLGEVDDGLWVWPDSGEPEGLPWAKVALIGQRGSLLKVEWAGRELLLEFESNDSALEAAALIFEKGGKAKRPEPATSTSPGAPAPTRYVDDVQPATTSVQSHDADVEPTGIDTQVETPVPLSEDVERRVAPHRARPRRRSGARRVLRTALKTILAIVFVALAAVGGIVVGQRLIGGEADTPSFGPRAVVIREASGDGDQMLGTFEADGPWKVLWDNEGDGPLVITATDSAGAEHVLVDAPSIGQDTASSELTGQVSVRVDGDGPWRVAILERDAAAIDG